MFCGVMPPPRVKVTTSIDFRRTNAHIPEYTEELLRHRSLARLSPRQTYAEAAVALACQPLFPKHRHQ